MEYTLKNNFLEVRVNSFGSELTGIRDLKTNEEYIWQKDPKFWAKSSPVLFPFVGALKDNKYSYQGKTYDFPFKHGFARDYEHKVSDKGENFIEFIFSSNEETKKLYPFDFNFYMKYILDGRKVKIEYRVENLGNEDMYFSLGAHPAFTAPLKDGMDYSDYYLEFEKEENGDAKVLNGALIAAGKTENIFSGKILKLSKDRFINDAIIFEKTNSNVVYLKNTKNDRKIGFEYDGFRYIAFWNVPGAEYVCFEPWNGISDFDNCSGKLEEKVGIEKIAKKETYKRAIEITIFEV
ncbi:aldose 1-epimerase family protein [Fusobacterium sp.]|uniref:aldose 1-epimerase family protein n=1 Tax=Fusobacterium sp. TaxID=68766 RepID=UPI00260CDB44|nr:aldose 1-epimerase family protein [Fusobacterium sp.]